MNEIANFCTGACIPEDRLPFETSVLNKIIYTPGDVDLEEHSISLDGLHYDGHNELDHHSLFGYLQGKATSKYFTEVKKKRPFIISRNTFPGSGHYVSHWNGDNFATWDMLKYSIIGTMNMNFFGVPLTGSDICGFMLDTNEDLCEKWTVLGAFYPFSRNHNALGAINQEPFFWSNKTSANMKQAVQMKYSLLRYYYTQFWQIYSPYHPISTFFKPMFFEFPASELAYDDIERNIMLGQAIKLSPNLHPYQPNVTEEEFFFPKGNWCNLFDLKCIHKTEDGYSSLEIDPSHLNLHLREGWIIPFQDSIRFNDLNVYQLIDDSTDLIINLD